MPRPEDFFSERPPARIIGTESECSLQVAQGQVLQSYIDERAAAKAGLLMSGRYLNNGMRLYVDVSHHLEIDSAEALGPRQAAAADAAANLVLAKVVDSSGFPHDGLYRYAGITISNCDTTNGYHENFMFPRSITRDPSFDNVIASYLTSRVWAMGGALRQSFVLSQKARGIGGSPVIHQRDRLTAHKNKPMAIVPTPSTDGDILRNPGWARLEVRFADPGFSLTAQYLGFAATSLTLRVLEHASAVNVDRLADLSFLEASSAALQFCDDLDLKSTAQTVSGKRITALNYQEALMNTVQDLSEKIELPDDEKVAIPILSGMLDEMRVCELSKGVYGGLLSMLDFAPRHRYLTRRFSPEELDSNNPQAVAANLLWNRVLPMGSGMTYWSRIGSPFVTQQEIERLMITPPRTRAKVRGDYISNHHADVIGVDWATVKFRNGQVLKLDPYNTRG